MSGFRAWVRGLLGKKGERGPDTFPAKPQEGTNGFRSFADDHNEFALALYGEFLQRPDNVFFSPFSIRTALAMTYAGAAGETAVQMRRALRVTSTDQILHGTFSEIIQRLNAAGGGKYEMAVANSLWGQTDARFEADFLESVARHYGGGMQVVDFRHGAEAARGTINRWVEDRTKQKIRELIPAGGLGSDARLVLVNAVYFRGMWVLPFHKTATRDAPFYLEGGGKMQTPLMHQHQVVRYLKADDFQAVDLDYRGGDLSLLVLLPGKRDGLRDLEARLSTRMLDNCVAKMPAREVELFLPRFRMTWGTVELGTCLRALGMPLAFTRFQADFSAINGHEPPHEDSLFLSAVFHKAFLEVHEEGTEAAAATGVVMDRATASGVSRPPPVPIVRADHPFLFAIRDRKSSAILFLGRVADPTRES